MTKIRLETPTVLADGILKTDNPINASLQVVKDQENNESALEISTDETGLKASSTATTQTTAVIQATDTNSGIAIVPNGTGAITNVVPDGTNLGGNARGQNSLDISFRENVSVSQSEVASGNYSVMFGYRNKITDNNSSILGGKSNSITGNSRNIIVGGQANSIAFPSQASFIGAGTNNSISRNYSAILGGQFNTTSTNEHATVVGGYQNSSTGQYSISGGYSNVASGQGAVAIGSNNTATANYSIALGRSTNATGIGSVALGGENYGSVASGKASIVIGEYNTASANYSSAIGGLHNESAGLSSLTTGVRGKSYLYGSSTQGGFMITTTGVAQKTDLISSKQDTLTTGATTTLSLDGTGTTNLIIPDGNNRVWNVTIKYTAVVTSITGTATGVSVGDCKNEVLTIGFKKIGGISQNVGAINIVSTNEDASMNSAVFGISAGPSQEMKLDFSAPTFTGGGSLDIRVVAKVELTEVAY